MEKNMENELEIGTREGGVGCLRYSGVLLVEEPCEIASLST